jgi:hypothetical protein
MGKRAKTVSCTAAVGTVGELMFAAEARSRGCDVLFPVGGTTEGYDLVVVTPTRRKLTVQVKAQSTRKFCTTSLDKKVQSSPMAPLPDIVAVFHGEWHLIPKRVLTPLQKTINVNFCKQWLNRWAVMR